MIELLKLKFKVLYKLIIVSLCFKTNVFAQDSIANIVFKEPQKIEKDFKFFFGLDSRRSFVLEKNTRLNGLKFGATYKNSHRFGAGVYLMQFPITFVGDVDRIDNPESTDTVRFNFGYGSVFYEYIWYKSKRWELSSPIHFGLGDLSFSYLDTSSIYRPLYRGGALMSELTGVAQFKVFRWFAIGTGLGYRMMLVDDKTIRNNLNSPVYLVQFKLLFGEIYKITFRRKNLEEWD